jgi:hypothetical protein
MRTLNDLAVLRTYERELGTCVVYVEMGNFWWVLEKMAGLLSGGWIQLKM